MSANKTVAQRLGRVLETLTRQSGRLPETPAYGSLLLGRVTESQGRRRIRIQIILTVLVMACEFDWNRRRRAVGDGRHTSAKRV